MARCTGISHFLHFLDCHFQPQQQSFVQILITHAAQSVYPREIPGRLYIVCQINHFFQQCHPGPARSVPPDGVVDLLIHAEHIPGQSGTGLGMEQLERFLFQLIQGNAVMTAQGQLLFHIQFLVQSWSKAATPGFFHIRTIPFRQANGLLLCSQHVGNALIFQIAQRHRPQLGKRQMF